MEHALLLQSRNIKKLNSFLKAVIAFHTIGLEINSKVAQVKHGSSGEESNTAYQRRQGSELQSGVPSYPPPFHVRSTADK